jgi:uncharacterized damage-inducible protein DinB
MKRTCLNNLQEIKHALEHLSDSQYSQKLEVLSGSSVGEHVRHVLEFYVCLFDGVELGVVNYDNRKRDLNLQSKVSEALGSIGRISTKIESISDNLNLVLEGDCGVEEPVVFSIPTNLHRELSYNLEHSVHHQAIIKIGLRELSFESIVGSEFGVAASTIRVK